MAIQPGEQGKRVSDMLNWEYCPLSGYQCEKTTKKDGSIFILFRACYSSSNKFLKNGYSITAKAYEKYFSTTGLINKRLLWCLVAEWMFYNKFDSENPCLTLCTKEEKNHLKNYYSIEELLKKYPTPDEILNKILRFFCSQINGENLFPSIIFDEDNTRLDFKLPILFINNMSELKMLLDELVKLGYLSTSITEKTLSGRDNVAYTTEEIIEIRAIITPKGIMHFKGFIGDSNNGFVAMKFGASPEWKDSKGVVHPEGERNMDEFFDNVISKAVEKANYTPVKLDKVDHNNKICDELLVQIRKAKFLVCDLTYGNQGAYYEAGFAHGLSKQVFLICEKNYFEDLKGGTHFDVNHQVTIPYELDKSDDLINALASKIANNVVKI